MARSAFFANFFLVAAAIVLASCGSNRQLQSVTVTPVAADAKNSADGKVQFTAIGVFSDSSMPVTLTSQQVTWCYAGSSENAAAGMCAGNIAQYATVDQNGLAQCAPLNQGTVSILAGTQPVSMNPDGGTQLKLFGAAQLTCP